MIRILIGFLLFIFITYLTINYILNQNVEYVDLFDGDKIDNAQNTDNNTKQFSYSFWLYMTKPPTYPSTIFSQIKNENNKIVLSANNSTLTLILDDSMSIYLDNFPFQKWNYINIVYFSGTIEFYLNSVLEKTLEIPVQNIYTESLVNTEITIGNYNNDEVGWQKNNSYIAHFNYDPNSSYDQDKIKSLYKVQINSLVNDDSLSMKVSLLKNGIAIN
tara:strand:+ start:3620 stop:4270 length:651 start_codon:yes stop_codon:yes gene_type:complete